ncbi:MAG: HAMP domain-containing histidine kinase [Phycisphaerales bacterium]|nr:MAG: HAMP domain-containing histidine kinase [Phycisphaerales bacterium]
MDQPLGPDNSEAADSRYVPEPYRAGALVSMLQLHWFIRLRWCMVVGALVALAVERGVFQVKRPGVWGLVLAIAALALINVGWMVLSRLLTRRVGSSAVRDLSAFPHALLYANAQVSIDLLLLTLILRCTGGVESPMAIFYLFHMAIGSLLLKASHALLQGVWATALYAGLGIGELAGWIQPHYAFLPGLAEIGLFDRPQYVAVAITVLGCGVFGTLYFTLHIARRLDEREAQLRRTNVALQRSQRAITDLQQRRSRFMQTAAHQLKSPLAGIQTLTGLIRDDVIPAGALHSTCDKIIQRCRDGIAHVHELLTLARVHGADPRRRHASPIDVGNVVRELSEKNRLLAEKKGLTLECHVAQGVDLNAFVDSTDLKDCVANLLENAIKYTDAPGSITVTVRAEGSEPSGSRVSKFVSVTVGDTGMGIEPEMLTGGDGVGAGSVFDAFRRGNAALASGIPGSGLGLAIVREVIEQTHGRLRVWSRVGEGSAFTVMFPAQLVLAEGTTARDTRSSEIVIETDRPDADVAARAEEPNHGG